MSYIPEKVTYVYSAPKKVSIKWDDDETIVEQTVTPAFPVPTGHEKRMKTAERWAENNRSCHYEDGRWVYGDEEVKSVTVENLGFRVQLCGLERRRQGGRAYKVVTPEGYYVDLREDVLVETMINEGVSAGGQLGGEYIWAVMGSQMKLIRKDSYLHKKVERQKKRENTSALKNEDLVVGGVYITKKTDLKDKNYWWDYYVFLGLVKVGKRGRAWKPLWLRDHGGQQTPDFEENFKKSQKASGNYTLSKVEVIEKIAEVKIPDDFIQSTREMMIAELRDGIEEAQNPPAPRRSRWGGYYQITPRPFEEVKQDLLKRYRSYCLMYTTGEKPPVVEEYEKKKVKASS